MGFFQISGGIFFGFWFPLIAIVFMVAKYGDAIANGIQKIDRAISNIDERKRRSVPRSAELVEAIYQVKDTMKRSKAFAHYQDAVARGDTATLQLIKNRVTEIIKEEKHGLARHQSGH